MENKYFSLKILDSIIPLVILKTFAHSNEEIVLT